MKAVAIVTLALPLALALATGAGAHTLDQLSQHLEVNCTYWEEKADEANRNITITYHKNQKVGFESADEARIYVVTHALKNFHCDFDYLLYGLKDMIHETREHPGR